MADLNHIALPFYQDRAKSRKNLPPYTYICQSKSFTDKSIFFCAIPILFLSPFLFSALFSFFFALIITFKPTPTPSLSFVLAFFSPSPAFFCKNQLPYIPTTKNFFFLPHVFMQTGKSPIPHKISPRGGVWGKKQTQKPSPNPDLTPGPSPMGRGEHASQKTKRPHPNPDLTPGPSP
ncbi:MAG: hypothetical protein ACI4VB_10160, partial [Bradymonadia bacterium]